MVSETRAAKEKRILFEPRYTLLSPIPSKQQRRIMSDSPSDSPPSLRSMTNPYFKDIDLTKSDGIKLFNKAIEGIKSDDDKFDMSQQTIRVFLRQALKANNNFAWGKIVCAVPTTLNNTVHLLKNYSRLTLAQVVASARATWGDFNQTFEIQESDLSADDLQPRIRSIMISRWVCNSLTPAAEA